MVEWQGEREVLRVLLPLTARAHLACRRRGGSSEIETEWCYRGRTIRMVSSGGRTVICADGVSEMEVHLQAGDERYVRRFVERLLGVLQTIDEGCSGGR